MIAALTSPSMRIIHVITGLNTGGAETALCRLLETLHSPKFEHVVVALGDMGSLSARVGAAAEVHHLGMNPARPRARDLWRLRGILRASSPDLVHGWMYHANIAASLASVKLVIPLLWGIRQSLYDLDNEKRLTRLVIKAGARFSSQPRYILYNSSVSARQHEAAGYDSNRTRVIPNGFDTAAFQPDLTARLRIRAELKVPDDALLIGLIARVHPMKDHFNFLSAASVFSELNPGAYFVLVGDGADSSNAYLNELAADFGLLERLRWCGRRTDIAAIDAALDIACSSSSWGEAFPNAIGEAMACGIPCVATNVGDVPTIIGDTGVVVPPSNSDALAAGWAQLAALDTSARRAMGMRARQRIVERYSLAAVSKQFADLYASLISKG